jgi:hypothetical protein
MVASHHSSLIGCYKFKGKDTYIMHWLLTEGGSSLAEQTLNYSVKQGHGDA